MTPFPVLAYKVLLIVKSYLGDAVSVVDDH